MKLVERMEGLIKVRMKSRASLQTFASDHKNLICPSYHCPLALSFFFRIFELPPAHQRKVLKMLEVNEYSSWGNRWLSVKAEAQGMRNMNGKISETNLRPWPHPVLSEWPHAELSANWLGENITTFPRPDANARRRLGNTFSTLLLANFRLHGKWRLWNKQWGFPLTCP